MPQSVAPAFVKINYHSPLGSHVQIIPTLAWSPGSDAGLFATHAGGTTDAQTMIENLVNAISGVAPDGNTYDNFVIYSQPDPEDIPHPVAQGNLGIAGLDTTPGWWQAVQITMTFRTDAFGVMKIVVLDGATNNSFDKTTVLPSSGALFEIFGLLAVNSNGWAGRDNGQVAGFISQTVTLNEKLRRAYKLA